MRVFALALMPLTLVAQSLPTFEVASVRPNDSGSMSSSLERSGDRLTFTNVPLRECIAFAFGISDGRDQALETPEWMRDAKFDIRATLPESTSRGDMQNMMRALLAERFHLQTHTETKRVAAYNLTVAKGGPKLQRNTVRDDGSFSYSRGHIKAEAIGMTALANRLSGRAFDLDRLVTDDTGLDGAFDFELNWAAEGVQAGVTTEGSLFTSIREQLGLELKAQSVEIDVVVVDHADRTPVAN